jgi:subtilisin-like proprotein convertase family protein
MENVSLRRILPLLALLALAQGMMASCDKADSNEGSPEPGLEDGKSDAWNRANDPARFGQDFEYSFDVLKENAEGASEIVPWPDSYWPMVEDGYNYRWLGRDELSPAEKYDKVFNNWEPEVGLEAYMALRPYSEPKTAYDEEYYNNIGPATDWAHAVGGNRRARAITNPDGTLKKEFDEDGDGIVDEDLDGDEETTEKDSWGGLERWFGHCHAWAPASYSQPEPQRAVTLENVTFEISDIKALIQATFEGGDSIFLGGRCNLREVKRDEHGRIVDEQAECRDTNAGAFHVVLTNVVGRLGRSMVADVTRDYQVWNHPVRDYTILRQDEVDLARALELVNRSGEEAYPYNDKAVRFAHVELRFRYVVEGYASSQPYLPRVDRYTSTAYYEYLLEIDDAGNIIGGEWISEKRPDFLWSVTHRGTSVYHGGRLVMHTSNVQQLVDLATAPEPPVDGTQYTYESARNLAIPDNDPTGVSDTIDVQEDVPIAEIYLTLTAHHTYRGDLRFELSHGGQTVTVFDPERSDGGPNVLKTIVLGQFNEQRAVGPWTLTVIDEAQADRGSLSSWKLTVVAAPEPPDVDPADGGPADGGTLDGGLPEVDASDSGALDGSAPEADAADSSADGEPEPEADLIISE